MLVENFSINSVTIWRKFQHVGKTVNLISCWGDGWQNDDGIYCCATELHMRATGWSNPETNKVRKLHCERQEDCIRVWFDFVSYICDFNNFLECKTRFSSACNDGSSCSDLYMYVGSTLILVPGTRSESIEYTPCCTSTVQFNHTYSTSGKPFLGLLMDSPIIAWISITAQITEYISA